MSVKLTSDSIQVSESIGSVSCEVMEPPSMRAMLVFAHGAGAGMNHPFMVKVSAALAEASVGTIRFNFPYMEQKKKRPDVAPVAEKTVSALLDFAAATFKDTPLFAGGKSFGGRMTSQLLSKENTFTLKGIVFFGFPLHPAGKPSIDRAEHLHKIQLPMLFLQGTRDALAVMNLMEPLCNTIPIATLTKFEGADHAFHVPRKDLIPLLAQEASEWMIARL
ncbi:MAG TPA: alpha/beta family hydrolase [Ohtaekwangia sp.]